MRWVTAIACLFAALSVFGAEGQKRAITHEDVWLMRSIGEPVVSPDGKWVVVSVTEPAYDPRDRVSDLWILSVNDEKPPRRLTSNKPSESGVAWSADNSKIAFSSKRDGDAFAQIYVMDLLAGGEAERVTNLSSGARDPHWSPDGRKIAYLSDVAPEDTTEAGPAPKARKYNARVYEGFPVRHWDHWLDERRPHVFVQELSAGAKPRDLIAGTWLAKLPGYSGKRTEKGEELPLVWSPDGASILFVVSINTDRAAYSDSDTDLFLVSAQGGEPRRLTDDSDSYGKPVFTPDGKSLVVKVTPEHTGYAYSLSHIVRFPWPFDAEQRLVLTPNFERDPNDPVVAGDGTWVYFTAEDAGQEKIYGVDIEGGETQLDYAPPTGVFTKLAGGGAGETFRLIGIWDSAVSPPEVVAHQPGDPNARHLSQFNSERLADVDVYPVEHFWIQSSANQRVHSLLIRPPGFDPLKKYPILAIVHGGPHLMFRDTFGVRWNYHLLAVPGFLVVATNYTGSTGFGEAFARGVHGNPMRAPSADINETIDEVVRRYPFADGARVAAAGASYGGHLVNWLQATTTRYRCLVAHASLVNLESQWGTSDSVFHREQTNGGPIWEQGAPWREQNPVRLVGNHFVNTGWVTPILLTVGEKDFRVPVNNTLENWSYLQRLQVASKLIVFPDEGHWIERGENSRYWYSEVRAWLDRWIGTPPAATE